MKFKCSLWDIVNLKDNSVNLSNIYNYINNLQVLLKHDNFIIIVNMLTILSVIQVNHIYIFKKMKDSSERELKDEEEWYIKKYKLALNSTMFN